MLQDFFLDHQEIILNLSETSLVEVIHNIQRLVGLYPQNIEQDSIYLYLQSSIIEESALLSQYAANSLGQTLKYHHFIFLDFDDFQNTSAIIFKALNDAMELPCPVVTLTPHLQPSPSQLPKDIEQIYLAKGAYWSETLMMFSDRFFQIIIETPPYFGTFMQYLQADLD